MSKQNPIESTETLTQFREFFPPRALEYSFILSEMEMGDDDLLVSLYVCMYVRMYPLHLLKIIPYYPIVGPG